MSFLSADKLEVREESANVCACRLVKICDSQQNPSIHPLQGWLGFKLTLKVVQLQRSPPVSLH